MVAAADSEPGSGMLGGSAEAKGDNTIDAPAPIKNGAT